VEVQSTVEISKVAVQMQGNLDGDPAYKGQSESLPLYKKAVLDQENTRLGYLVVFSITLLK
jgi:hypothetical protein